ncbi:MAG: hypothetical protein ACTSPI_00475 [Candidatus Heimdallarchaeaceae archaeon]
MTEEQVKNGERILNQLAQARNIKTELENEQSYFIIVLKNRRDHGITTIDFNYNTITQKFFPAIEDYIGSYLHDLVDNEIKHFEKELENV